MMSDADEVGDDGTAFPETAHGAGQYQVAKIALGAIDLFAPGLGYSLQVFTDKFIGDPIQKRQAEWLTDLAKGVAELKEHVAGFNPDDLAANDEFVSVVAFGVQAAARTHLEEKRAALCNAALNIAAGVRINEILLGSFLGYIDRYTATHIAILRLMADPSANDEFRAYGEAVYLSGTVGQGIRKAMPDLGESELAAVVRDIESEGLASTALNVMMSGQGVLAKRTSETGDAFLRFISSPARE